jgi:NAD(P)-dependent dehydrogenase (short-subunit alcohol dehydrogenase family)
MMLPDLSGRRYLVTGSTAGLGFFASLQLAGAGAHVIMTGRNPNKLATARIAVRRQVPDAEITTLLLDTSNLGSVRAAAATVRGRAGLHGLLLNAGVVHPPRHRETTADGHEVVFATNALGHYALAGELLLPLAAGRGRMVGRVDVDRDGQLRPRRPRAGDELLAVAGVCAVEGRDDRLGFEADRRLRAANVPIASLSRIPGTRSADARGILGINEPSRMTRFVDNLQAPITQSKERGAWPLVRALVDPEAVGGQFWGPSRLVAGAPTLGQASKLARREDIATRLWDYCEHATGITWPYLKASRPRRLWRRADAGACEQMRMPRTDADAANGCGCRDRRGPHPLY